MTHVTDLILEIWDKHKEQGAKDIAEMIDKIHYRPGMSEISLLLLKDNEFTEHCPIYVVHPNGVLEDGVDHYIDTMFQQTWPTAAPHMAKFNFSMFKSELLALSSYYKKDVKPFGLADDPGLFWNKLKTSRADIAANPIDLKDIPEFAQFLSLIKTDEERRSFLIFAGSIFDGESSRHQYLHMHGDGGEGKSTFAEVLKRALTGRSFRTVRASEIGRNHFGDDFEGKRLLIFADENNPSFVQSGPFKELTGEDSLSVNPKYKNTRTINLSFKTMIISNSEIMISSEEADKRRLISVRLNRPAKPYSVTWRKGFLDKWEEIVCYLIQNYEKELAQDPSIRHILPSPVESKKKAIAKNNSLWKEALEVAGIQFDLESEESIMRCSEVHNCIFKKIGKEIPNWYLEDFKIYLKSQGVITSEHNAIVYYKYLKTTKKSE